MKILIEGRPVEVGDDWGQLSNDEKNRRVEDVAKKQMIVSPTAPDQYRGAVLPFVKDAAGNTKFDITAGLPGTVVKGFYDAFTLPGDVATGAQPVIDPQTGRPSDQLMDRSRNFAQAANLTSPATIAGRASMMQVPTANQLRDLGGADLNAARATGAQFQGFGVRSMVDDLLDQYRLQGRVGELAKETRGTVANMAPAYGANVDIATLMAHRETLLQQATSSRNPHESATASQAVKAIDEFLHNLPPSGITGGTATGAEITDLLARGRGNYGASQRANAFSGDLDEATTGLIERAQARAAAANSGRNFDNTLRQRVGAFLEDKTNLFGYSPEELEMLRMVRDGTASINMTRSVANLLGGGGGMGQAVTSGGLGSMAGGATLATGASPSVAAGVGTGVGVGVGVLGRSLKALENFMALQKARGVDEAIRLRSPEGQRRLANQPDQWSARDVAVMRSLTPPGLLGALGRGDAPPPQPGYVTSDDPAWTRRLPPGFI